MASISSKAHDFVARLRLEGAPQALPPQAPPSSLRSETTTETQIAPDQRSGAISVLWCPAPYSRPFSSFTRASSSVTLSANDSSLTRMPRARSSIDFSAVERPLPFSRSARFRTTSATW
jgi:hypothetical protein